VGETWFPHATEAKPRKVQPEHLGSVRRRRRRRHDRRQDALNALDLPTLTELRDRLRELADDAGARVSS